MEKASFARSRVCQRGQNCMLHAMLQGCTKYLMLKESKEMKNSHNTVDLRHLSLMLKELKVHLIYNVDSNSKYSNEDKV